MGYSGVGGKGKTVVRLDVVAGPWLVVAAVGSSTRGAGMSEVWFSASTDLAQDVGVLGCGRESVQRCDVGVWLESKSVV